MSSRLGCFVLGFGTGVLTVVAYRRLREHVLEEDYERVAVSMQDNLAELEARLGEAPASKPKRKSA